MINPICHRIVKLACVVVSRILFQVRVAGREHIPASGPALLVSNHLTHFDGFLIGSCLRGPIRFLVWKPYYDHPLLRWGFRLGKSIPVEPGPFTATLAIVEARRGLERGDMIGLFAEGSISRTGKILPFQRGLEVMIRDLDVPIVPIHLSGLWESVFSYRGGKFLWKRQPHLRQPVTVSFGAPLLRPSRAEDVRLAVQQLGSVVIDAARSRVLLHRGGSPALDS